MRLLTLVTDREVPHALCYGRRTPHSD